MSVAIVFLLVIAGISGWWLSQQRLMSKPWLEVGPGEPVPAGVPIEKIALGVFLAVVAALFALFASAYVMRMEYSDWRQLPVPRLLWINTGLLALASVELQCALTAARARDLGTVRLCLMAAGVATAGFVTGQLLVWRELIDGGYVAAGNPANGFFYLLTGAHGLHILGGMVALAWTTASVFTGSRPERLTLRVELCTMYWHFLFFVWIGLFVLLAGWANGLVQICRQLLS
jgi:cytochrome c oxidase subunit 3